MAAEHGPAPDDQQHAHPGGGRGPQPARLMSATPGRLRVRLSSRPGRDGQAHDGQLGATREAVLRHVHAGISGEAGIRHVQTNPSTGSVTIHYDPATRGHDDVLGLLYDLGVVVHDVAEGADEGPAEPAPAHGHSRPAAGMIGALDDLDQRLSHLTGHRVDLKVLFPATLATIGVAQLLRQGVGLGEIPAYVLLWYAFDSFFKLHKETGRAVRHAAAEGEAAARRAAPANPGSGEAA
jgi:hypothetical protein